VVFKRICDDIEWLHTESEKEAGAEASRTRTLFFALAGHLAERGIVDHLAAAANYMENDGGSPTTEQIVWNTPLGQAMELFYEGATERDFRLKNKLTESIEKAIEKPAKGTNGRHLGMAVVDLARIMCLAQLGHSSAT